MLEFGQGFGDIARHGAVNGMVSVVPGKGHAKVEGAIPVSGDGVKGLKGCDEVLSMVAANVLDAKIINHEGEGDGSGLVVEEAVRVWDREVTGGGKVLDKTIIGYDASLGKAVHTFADFNEDPAVVDKRLELVVGHDARRDVCSGDVHVFKAFHWSVEVEVFDVNGHEASVRSGEDTVEEEFDS